MVRGRGRIIGIQIGRMCWIQVQNEQILRCKFKNNNQEIQKMSEQVEHHILRKYSLVKKLGSGAYGHVWKVTDKKTSQTLALKKIFDAFQHSTDAQRTFREIVFLHELNHPNIIKLHNVIKAENDKDLYLVFQFMEADLHNAIGQKILKDIHNRFIIYQIVKGIKFLHSAEIIHRDLKPSNVLLNSDCHLKICDFGLARSLVADREGTDMILTEEVATRWYRAPEVLLGSQCYEKSADIWSIGCILGQILIGKPMFPGNSTLNQLERIISFTGHPSKQDILSLNSQIALSMISSITLNKVKNIKDWFKSDTPQEAISLICKMLEFNPKKRPTADQILKSPYLSQFHNPKEEYESAKIIYPPVSDNKKLNLKQYRQLIYDRIKKIYKNDEDIVNSVSVANSSSNSCINPKLSNHSSGNRNNYQFSSYSTNKNNKQDQYSQDSNAKDREEYTLTATNHTPIRHSAGKMKTASYSSSCSSFNQFVNSSNNGGVSSHASYSCFYAQGSGHDGEEYNKIQKKSSLKEILKNKKHKQEMGANSAYTGNIGSNGSSNSMSKYASPSSTTTTTNTASMNPNMPQQSYAQKYYKKSNMNASIYKENKLGRHV